MRRPRRLRAARSAPLTRAARSGFEELGQQKVLPDTSFLHKFRDKVEAVIITHGHEDHIGALPWIVPALDPATPIYASSFTMALIKRRMTEYGLWNPSRFKLFTLGPAGRWNAGPFSVEAVRVTHSIPDCSGLIFRCGDGTIVHTGDWKIDETPMDGEMFDRSAFEAVGREGVTLFMSDSTNVLSAGRTTSESLVADSLLRRVGDWTTGRVVATCFASNIHRLEALKAAADASGRKLVLMGMSLNTYLEAAFRDKRASFSPAQLMDAEEVEGWDPSKLLIVTTGSQAEPRAMLSRAAYGAAKGLKISDGDLLLYSAKMIPGNEKRVMKMLNALSQRGAALAVSRSENLHASGHAHTEELSEVLRLVRPQHFLPVHGEYAFLKEHEALGRACGIQHTCVIQNGQMMGCGALRSGRAVGRAGTMQLLGETKLQLMYNDGSNSSGTRDDCALEDRVRLANEGLIVASVRVFRNDGDIAAAIASGYREGASGTQEEAASEDAYAERKRGGPKRGALSSPDSAEGGDGTTLGDRVSRGEDGPRVSAAVTLQLRALYTAGGAHETEMQAACEQALHGCSAAAPGWELERAVKKACATTARRLMGRKPEIITLVTDALRTSVDEKAVASSAARRGAARAAAAAAAEGEPQRRRGAAAGEGEQHQKRSIKRKAAPLGATGGASPSLEV